MARDRDMRIDRRWRNALNAAVIVGALLFPLIFPLAAWGQVGSDRYSSIVVDAQSGEILEAVNIDAPRHPASLTKMMTLYMAFEAVRDRRIRLDQFVPVSAHAASMEPTKLGLMPGTHITVEQSVLGLVTKSANDAAAALGELLGGTEDRFAQMMTLRARSIGMSHTTFTNASGLPDPDQWTTARDLAVLGRRLISDFPGYYHYFATPSFRWGRHVIFNHDRLLQTYPGADGLKTGYTVASGYNLVTSASRGGVRLIGVVLGASSGSERAAHMTMLLNQGFERMNVLPERRPTTMASRALIPSASAAPVEPPARQSAARSQVPWAIQVGSYPSERAAREAAAAARRAAEAGEIRIETAHVRHKPVWRAQVTGLTAPDAQAACASMARRRIPCLVIRPETRQVASQ